LHDGDYEMRMYRNSSSSSWNSFSEETHIMSVPFTVDCSSVTISLDKASYASGEKITVTTSGITQGMAKTGALIAIYKSGDPHSVKAVTYKSITAEGAGRVEFTDRLADDNYEMRIHRISSSSSWSSFSAETFIMSVPFSVGGAAPATPPAQQPADPQPPVQQPPVQQPANPQPPSGNPVAGFRVESINVGVILRWNPLSGGVGYRVYRSDNSSVEGISITDFYITSNEFVDVNVKANRTYYYTVRQVISEARPFEGLLEQLGPVTSNITVTTASVIAGGDMAPPPDSSAIRKFILMTIGDPYMSVNGLRQEIDPGRGTTPLIENSRTLVPIRAIVEGMGGSVAWDENAREIALGYVNNNVRMWLDKENIVVNGGNKTIDVPPKTINDRTMVPIRFAAENLGCHVDWLNSTSQVVIVYY
jgi:hypothetical protein